MAASNQDLENLLDNKNTVLSQPELLSLLTVENTRERINEERASELIREKHLRRMIHSERGTEDQYDDAIYLNISTLGHGNGGPGHHSANPPVDPVTPLNHVAGISGGTPQGGRGSPPGSDPDPSGYYSDSSYDMSLEANATMTDIRGS